jgi:hypothetical protein
MKCGIYDGHLFSPAKGQEHIGGPWAGDQHRRKYGKTQIIFKAFLFHFGIDNGN